MSLLEKMGVHMNEFSLEEMVTAIPFNHARLCLNCEHIVKVQVCPVCGSTHHLLLGKVLGLVSHGREKEV